MKIASRNVNGIRAVLQKGFYDWVKTNDRDIICLQETKAFEHQLPAEFRFHMKDYNRIWHSGEKPGYSGVVTLYKKELNLISSKSKFEEIEQFHEDGRVVETKFYFLPVISNDNEKFLDIKKGDISTISIGQPSGVFTLLNIYFPNGGERANGDSMLDYKLKFYDHFIHYINTLRTQRENIIITGDFNICHREIDIARPKENENSIGFLPIEREKLDKLQNNGYTDVFRYFNPNLIDHYTRRSYRAGARPRNVGRRLDYFRVSENIIPKIKKMTHQSLIEGSDHCPISLELDF